MDYSAAITHNNAVVGAITRRLASCDANRHAERNVLVSYMEDVLEEISLYGE